MITWLACTKAAALSLAFFLLSTHIHKQKYSLVPFSSTFHAPRISHRSAFTHHSTAWSDEVRHLSLLNPSQQPHRIKLALGCFRQHAFLVVITLTIPEGWAVLTHAWPYLCHIILETISSKEQKVIDIYTCWSFSVFLKLAGTARVKYLLHVYNKLDMPFKSLNF